MIDKPQKTQTSIKQVIKTKPEVSERSMKFPKKFFLGFASGVVVVSICALILHKRVVASLFAKQEAVHAEASLWKEKFTQSSSEIVVLKEELARVKGLAEATSESITRMIASEENEEPDKSKCVDSSSGESCFNEGLRMEKFNKTDKSILFYHVGCNKDHERSCLKIADAMAILNFVKANEKYKSLCKKGSIVACRRLGQVFSREGGIQTTLLGGRFYFSIAAEEYEKACELGLKSDGQDTASDCSATGLLYRASGQEKIGIKYLAIACKLGRKEDCQLLKGYPLSDINKSTESDKDNPVTGHPTI